MLYRLLTVLLFLVPAVVLGQCPQFYDNDGNLSSSPLWKFCDDAASTLNIQSNQDLGPYTIDWGDGNSSSGPSLTAGSVETHNYPAGIQTYTITITVGGCTITGTYVKELPVKASIEVPPNGVTQVCAPGSMDFLNNSTGNSTNTIYTWRFGDGETLGPLDHTNAGQTVSHTYQAGTVDCDTRVTLIAQNICSTRPSEATFEPVQIWDIDKAGLNASPTLLCWPDNEVTYTNQTERNCVLPEEGNTFQRFERWIFHDFFGPGMDSIIDWRPWPPSPPRTIAYPGPGTYDVTLQVRNYCGDASITRSITIIDEPEALFSLSKDTICVGELLDMTKLTGAPANRFRYTTGANNWANFGNGNSRSFSYDTPGTYQVGFAIDIANSSPACKDTTYLPIVVLPDPIAKFDINDSIACGSLTVSITDKSVDAISWDWDFGNGQTFSGQNPPDVEYNTAGSFQLSLTTVNAKGCESSYSKEIQIFSPPEPDFNDGFACVGQEYTFNGTAIEEAGDPILDWDWDFGDATNGSGQNTSHIFFLNGPRSVILTVTTEYCTAQVSKVVDIKSVPTASFTPSPSVGCASFTSNFSNSSLGASKYYWDFDDGTVDSVNTDPSHVFYNPSGSNITRDVQLIALNAFGCGDTFTRAVLVKPEITADFDQLITDNCTSVDVQFRNLSTGGNQYFWDFGDTTTSNQQNPLHTYVNNGQFKNTYTITFTVTNPQGCSDTKVEEIEIKPAAVFTFEGVPEASCTPTEVTFQAQSGAVEYEWDFGDGTTATGQVAKKKFVNNTQNVRVYTVTLRSVTSEGCVDVAQNDITIYPKPIADFDVNETAACSPLNLEITNNSVGAENYLWNYGDGDVSANSNAQQTHLYENTSGSNKIFNLRLEVISEHGCRDTMEREITVYPGIDGTFTGVMEGCTPFATSFSASGGDGYLWDFGDGNTSNVQNPSHTFYHNGQPGPTPYEVRLEAISNNACNAVITDTVWVYPQPQSAFTISETQGCTPLDVSFIPQASGATAYNWLFQPGVGTSNTGASVNHTYVNNGQQSATFNPRLIVSNSYGCTDTSFNEITVFPPVQAHAVHQDTGCSPLEIKFFNVSQGAASYVWDFGAFGSSGQVSPNVVFYHNQSSYTDFPISLIASSPFGCRDTFETQITLYPRPEASFSLSSNAGCEPLDITFSNLSSGAVSYTWDYGNGQTDAEANPSFQRTFLNPNQGVETRKINLIAKNQFNCTDTTFRNIQVFPRVVAKFDSVPDACSPHEILVRNESEGDAVVRWFFSDGTQSANQNQLKVFNNNSPTDKQEFVRLVATNNQGCTDTLTRFFKVLANPVADFTVSPEEQKYPSAQISTFNNTVGSWTYEWDFGDGGTDFNKNASHSYATWGNYTIWLYALGNNCKDSVSKTISILPPAPIANFSGSGQGCRPLTVQFSDNSTYAVSHRWDFGDGGYSPASNPSYTYYNVGEYDVSLTVVGPDGTSDTYTIPKAAVVHENASAFFTFSPSTAFAREDPVDFSNLSQQATMYTWDFGDGNTSTEQHPTHYYEAPGVYDIQLIANNQFNCPDTFLVQQQLTIIDGGYVDLPNAFTPNPNGPSGGRYNKESLDNDVFFAFNKDVEEFKMEIFTRWGEKIFESNDVEIGWDGYSDGVLCQQEVYVYKVFARFSDGRTVKKIGDVTLLR